MENLILTMEIETQTKEACMELGYSICQQLVGKEDFINDNIVVNYTDTDNVVRLYIFKECKEIPDITLFLKKSLS